MGYALDDEQTEIVAALCEAFVPGSSSVGPVVFIDAVAAGMEDDERGRLLDAVAALDPVRREGAEFLARTEATESFELMRALAIDAYYSDFSAPGHEGPTAWDAVDFNSPQGRRLRKDWSYLRSHR